MKRLFSCLICLFALVPLIKAEKIRIMSYNVENFFDCRHDTLKQDLDYTPFGTYRWTPARFNNKAKQIARVICQGGQWDKPCLVGLCEVENDSCLIRLLHNLKRYPYKFLHKESPDVRGIDVALLYDTTRFQLITSNALQVDLGNTYTRDILYAIGRINNGDTLHVMMCHLPSMRGGAAQSEWKRLRAKQVIQRQVNKILRSQPNANIVVMGDMNSSAKNDIKGLKNRMVEIERKDKGTYKYQGKWSCLDQFYLSPCIDSKSQVYIYDADFLLEPDNKHTGSQPLRTFKGYRYNRNGYSDHLPIVLDWTL